jgi:sugar (glycoside-pentoside-hexuronide) transporter
MSDTARAAAPRLSFCKKLAYGVGDTGTNFLFQMSIIYLLFFYTDVFGLSAAEAGIIFVIARVIDAVANPVMGYVMDHTRSKLGNARVYLKYGPLPLAIVSALLYFTPGFGEAGKFVWALLCYVTWSLLFTMVNIPYASMTAQLTDDPGERTSLTSVRMIFMLVGVVVVSVVTEPLSSSFANPQEGYFAVGILYAVLAFVLFIVCYRGTRSLPLIEPKAGSEYRARDILRVLWPNKPALLVMLIFFLGASAEYVRESSVVYYVTYNMGDSSLVPAFLGLVVLSMVGGNLLIPALAAKLDKRGVLLLGMSIACVSSAAFQFIPYDQTALILVFAVISSLGFCAVATMGWAMLPDTVEYGELKTGVRSEGIIYAFFSFTQKLATAVGGGIVSMALALSGYVPKAPKQSADTLFGIASTVGLIPLGLLFLSLIATLFYKLDRKSFEEVKKELGRIAK